MPVQEKINIFDKCKDVWRLVCREVKRASVYLDSSSIESLHWYGGIDMLYQSGAVEVKQFNTSESSSPKYQKAVFVLSSIIEGEISKTLRSIIECSNFQYIILINGLPPSMHTTFKYGTVETNENRAFTELETTLCEWMGNMNYTVEVMHIPFGFCNILPELIILPQDGNFMPLLPNELDELVKQARTKNEMKISDIEFINLMKEGQLQYKLLVTAIDCVLQQLQICEDIFSMGFTSKAIATELASLPAAKQRRKAYQQNKASMLIIDRTVDVLSAAGHRQDNLLDYCLNVLKPLEDHLIDIETDMSDICGLHPSCKYTLSPGCLSQPQCTRSKNLLKQLAYSKYDDALASVLRNLIESASKENLLSKPPKLSKIGREELKSILSLFRKKIETMKYESGILQISQSVIDALDAEHKRKQFLAAEKGILMAEESSAALLQVNESLKSDLQKDEDGRVFTIDDYLCLLTFVYSAYNCNDDLCGNYERDIKLSLLELIYDTKEENLPTITKNLIIRKTKGDQYKIISDLFDKLRAISSFGQYFKQYRERSLIPSAANSVLQNIVKVITDSSKPEMTDVTHHATGFRQLLRTGFGFLTGATKARPGDQPILIICVLGGITVQEVKSIVETISSSNIQPIIISTNIIKSNSFIKNLLSDHIHPESVLKYMKTFV